MIIYNVTINVEDEIHDAWLVWMKDTHLPMIMDTGKFESYKMMRLLSRQEDETGMTYAIQYFAKDMESYEDYASNHAPALQQHTQAMFGGKFIAFRTLMELTHENI